MISSLLLRSAPVLGFLGGVVAQQSYQLDTEYSGASFFDEWDFFTGTDPSEGFVTYVDQKTANNDGLAYVDGDGIAHMGVDSTTVLDPSGAGRESVRITTKKNYTHGLIISDIVNMPAGVCGTWPAFWTFGTDWPNSGEIDIIEGVNSQSSNLMSLHVGGTCSVAGDQQTGTLQTANCDQAAGFGSGCGTLDTSKESYGAGFNANGGGVFATQWTSDFIRIWFFPAGSVPQDITQGNPNPDISVWGEPVSNFEGSCTIDDHFKNHYIVFDTTFCGDWAGAVWANDPVCSALAPTCEEYVALNPDAFNDMYWSVKSVKIYQLEDTPSTPPSSSAAPTTTSTSSTSSTEPPSTTSESSTSTTESSTSTASAPSSTTSTSSDIGVTTSDSSTSSTLSLASSTETSTSSAASTGTSTSGAVLVQLPSTTYTATGTFSSISTSSGLSASGSNSYPEAGSSYSAADSLTSAAYGASTTVATYTPAGELTTSTVYATSVYTVTSCAPTVTNCPARLGYLTTEIISLYTTVCPVTATETPALISAVPQSSVYGFGKGGPATVPYVLTTYTALTVVGGFTTTIPVVAPAVYASTSIPKGSNAAVVPTKGASGPVQTSLVTVVPVATPAYPLGNSNFTVATGTGVATGATYSGVSVSGAAQLNLTRLCTFAAFMAFIGALVLL